jgi:acyl-CoA thioester hydrolase
MDRARMEAIEEICNSCGDRSWLEDYVIKIYRIEARCATVVRLSEPVEVRTGIRKISPHRAAFDQRIISIRTGEIVADASVEVLFLDSNDNFVSVPDEVAASHMKGQASVKKRSETISFKDEDHFPFRTYFRVYFEDTDCQTIMFHVSYVRFCERALFDLVRAIWPDMSANSWMSKNKVSVAKIDIRYLKSAKLGDRLEVRTGLIGLTPFELNFGQRIVNRQTGEVLADAVTHCEFRDEQGNIVSMPKQVLDISKANLFGLN